MIDKWLSLRRLLTLTVLLMIFTWKAPTAFANPCLADINLDGKIDTKDLEIMQDELDRDNCFAVPCRADLNGDGKVNGKDAEFLIVEFGQQDCFAGTRDIFGEQKGIPHIGQDTEFDSAEEEDAEEGIEPPKARFIDNGNGTVTDPETGLMWTQNTDMYGDTLLFHETLNYIEGMNTGDSANFGYTDWRLPTLSELRSLIDYTRLTRKEHTLPPGHPFDNVQSFNVNSESSYISTTDYSWFVSLYCRLVGHNVNSCFGYVWPVRGGK